MGTPDLKRDRLEHQLRATRVDLDSAVGKLQRANRALESRNAELKEAEYETRRLLTNVQAEKDRVSALVDSIADEVWFADTNRRFTLANPSARQEFALGPGEVEVERLAASLEVLRPDGSPRPIEEAPPLRALAGELVRNQEEIVRTPGAGELRYRQVSATPVRDATGAIIGSVSVARDITDRKRAEEALRESEATLRGILNASKESIWLFSKDGVALLGNQTALARMGRPPEAILGKAIEELVPEEVARQRRARLEEAAATGRPVEFDDCRAGIFFEHHFYPVRGATGEVNRIAVFSRDVTDRKRQERRLEDLSLLYAVLSKVNEAIVRTREPLALYRDVCRIVAEDGRRPLVWIGLVEGHTVRPVAACGRALDYVQTLRVDTDGAFGQGPSGTCAREGRAVVNDDFDVNPRTTPWREAARRFHLRASAAFPLRHQGAVVGVLTLYADEPGTFDQEQVRLLEALSADLSYALDKMWQETALRESERSLREADRRKNEFLAVLSHELRNPLAPIRNGLYILNHSAPESPEAQRAKEVIDRQVGQLARLVDDLLDITRITQGKVHVRRAPVELSGLLLRTVEDHRSVLAKAGVDLEIRTGERPLWVHADAVRITQAVGNLLQNGAKFTGAGGRVTLTLEEDVAARMAVIRVRDSGIGIEPAILERLFEPFTQADSSIDRSKGGLGLGLALVKGLIELHGGSVRADSDGLGKGAEFTLRLPLHRQPAGAVAGSEPPAHAAGKRVLIIEDNVDAAESLRQVLRSGNHTVEVAYNGVDGIARARKFKPDVVLCDIGLPGMDGYGVARAMRADPELGSVVLVALTGYALPNDLARARAEGFADHLVKPPDLEKLEQILAQLDGPGLGA